MIHGRLFETPTGIPVLQVPEKGILAHGTPDPLADTATQARFAASMSDPGSNLDQLPKNATCAPWGSM